MPILDVPLLCDLDAERAASAFAAAGYADEDIVSGRQFGNCNGSLREGAARCDLRRYHRSQTSD